MPLHYVPASTNSLGRCRVQGGVSGTLLFRSIMLASSSFPERPADPASGVVLGVASAGPCTCVASGSGSKEKPPGLYPIATQGWRLNSPAHLGPILAMVFAL